MRKFLVMAAVLVGLIGTLVPLGVATASSPAAARMTLTSVSGPGGTTIIVRGSNLTPRTHVQITWDGRFKGLPMAWVTRTGSFRVSFTIPAGTAGAHKIGAYRVKSRSTKVVRFASQLGSRVAFAHFVRTTSATPPASLPITPPSGVASSAYGSINADTKANLRVGPDGTIAHRFVASTTSALTSVRFSQRGGPIYSGGTGGSLRISVRADDGSGRPSSTMLSSFVYRPGNTGGSWTTYLNLAFPAPATLAKGHTYYIQFENIDPAPSSNYISVNELFVYGGTLSPRQPMFADSAYAVLSNGTVQGKYTADMDLSYANGSHDGMGYIEAMVGLYGVISGSSQMVREHFTVSGSSRTIISASVRVRRTSGSSPLLVILETAAGATVASASIAASSIAASAPGGDNGGSVWVTARFSAALVLASGSTYNLRLSTASGTEYTTIPVREGTDQGYSSTVFRDGDGQRTTNGSTWANLYQYSPVDLQFSFR